MPAPQLTDLLQAPFTARQRLIERLHGEDTTAYRLFNGSGENWPGLNVDRYGDLLLIQTFYAPLDGHDRVAIERFYADALPGLVAIYNDRSGANSRVTNPLPAEVLAEAQKPREFHEIGIRYLVRVISTDVIRKYGEFVFDIRPVALAKNYFGKDRSFRFRHVIEPFITYRLVKGVDNFNKIIRFDHVDTAANTNEIEFGVTNRFIQDDTAKP